MSYNVKLENFVDLQAHKKLIDASHHVFPSVRIFYYPFFPRNGSKRSLRIQLHSSCLIREPIVWFRKIMATRMCKNKL